MSEICLSGSSALEKTVTTDVNDLLYFFVAFRMEIEF